MFFLKLINNSSSSKQRKYTLDCDGVWISDINEQRFLRFYFSVFLSLVLTEKIFQTVFKTLFDLILKHLEVLQICFSERLFSTLLSMLGNVT